MSRIRVAIVGGSGYTGGELIRLLLFHPQVELTQIASGSQAGHFVHSAHPNLRKVTTLRFCHPDDLTSCDVLFLCLPHGVSSGEIERYRSLAPRLIDLSGDFRLHSESLYQRWYGPLFSLRRCTVCPNCTARSCARQAWSAAQAAWPRRQSLAWLRSTGQVSSI